MLKNKTALITGAGRGIGRAIALNMAKNGANIAIIYAGNQQAAQETCDKALELGVMAKIYKCDVSDFNQTKQICDQIITDFKKIDILVNNAGITNDKLILQMKEDDFDKVVDINLKGAFNMIKHTFSHFMKNRSGRIINITSVVGMMGNAGQANYSSAKAGLIGLTKSTARELASRGITCNAIAPGFIETDMTKDISEAARKTLSDSIPMKKIGTPADVANLAVFLASDMASYITGEVVKIDGGLYM